MVLLASCSESQVPMSSRRGSRQNVGADQEGLG
jgi:hypothetical protein